MPRTLAPRAPLPVSVARPRPPAVDDPAADLDAPYRAGEILAALGVTVGGILLVWYAVVLFEVLAGMTGG